MNYQIRIYGLTENADLPLVCHTETFAQAIRISETTLPMRLARGIAVSVEVWRMQGAVPTAQIHRATYYSPH